MPTLIEVALLVVAVLGVVTGLLALGRRATSPLALPLALTLLGGSGWAAARALQLFAPSATVPAPITYATFPGVAVAIAASLWYFIVLAGHGARLTRRAALLLCIHPVFLLVALTTDPWHRLVFRAGTTASGDVVLQFGPLYWVHVAYCFAAVLTGLTLGTRAMLRSVRGHRRVYALSLLAAAIPLVGNAVTRIVDIGSSGQDVTPVLFLVSGAIWLWVERYGHQSGLVPVSARQVLAALADAVVVVDPEGRLLDANPAAQALLGGPDGGAGPRVIGAHWREVVRAEMRPAFEGGDSTGLTTEAGTVLEVRVTEMTADGGHPLGSVVVIRDVTEIDRLRVELAEQAVRDGLTGLHNRRHLERVLEAAIGHARASGEPLNAVMVDIDHFKQVNDRYGHAVGDQVLVQVAAALAAGVRAGDTVARFGGEEFVLLLPGVPAKAAVERAAVWRAQCAAIRVHTDDGPVGVTISAGVASLPAEGDADELLRLADDALYEAKAAGRDAVVLARPVDRTPAVSTPSAVTRSTG